MPSLEIKDLTVRFGGLVAVDSLDLTVGDGEIVGLIGPNGAGKTTVFNAVTGLYQFEAGQVLFDGMLLNDLKPHQRVKKGIARTFQTIRLFPSLTALETVQIGYHCRLASGDLKQVARSKAALAEVRENQRRAMELLEFMGLQGTADRKAAGLPYGVQRRLEIARALATQPKMLLLDEPAAGMNPNECHALMKVIEQIRGRGISILLIEHHMRVIMGVCGRIAVLNYGKKIAEGQPDEIRANQEVIQAYLGRRQDATA